MAYYALLDGLTLERFRPLPLPVDAPLVPTTP
jgi:hypothetical protein